MPADPRPPRDSQRSRVYKAESPMPASPLPGLDACASFADRVVGTLWWEARFPQHTLGRMPRFRPGNGARQAFFRIDDDGPTITLPRRYRTKGIVLHELVHWALDDQRDLPAHGRTFARVLLDTTSEFCGPEKAEILTESFVAQHVHVGGAPRTGPDGRLRYGCDERLRLARNGLVTLHWRDPAGETRDTFGRLVRVARGEAFVRDPTGDVVSVPVDAIWDVTARLPTAVAG